MTDLTALLDRAAQLEATLATLARQLQADACPHAPTAEAPTDCEGLAPSSPTEAPSSPAGAFS